MRNSARFISIVTTAIAVLSIASAPARATEASKETKPSEATQSAEDKTTRSTATAPSTSPATVPLSNDKARSLFQTWQRFDTIETSASKQAALAESAQGAIPSLKPVDSVRMSSPFGMRIHPISRRRAHHSGMDIPANYGSPIYAAADGRVLRANYNGGYGRMVEIEHSHNITTRYGHMSSIQIKRGDYVKRGDIIGYVGSTGRSTGNHLHYEVRIAGKAVDPSTFFHQPTEAEAAIQIAETLPAQSPESPTAIGGPEAPETPEAENSETKK